MSQLAKYVIRFEVINVYVEQNVDNPDTMDAIELGINIDDDDIQCIGFRSANVKVNDGCNVADDHNIEVNDMGMLLMSIILKLLMNMLKK